MQYEKTVLAYAIVVIYDVSWIFLVFFSQSVHFAILE